MYYNVRLATQPQEKPTVSSTMTSIAAYTGGIPCPELEPSGNPSEPTKIPTKIAGNTVMRFPVSANDTSSIRSRRVDEAHLRYSVRHASYRVAPMANSSSIALACSASSVKNNSIEWPMAHPTDVRSDASTGMKNPGMDASSSS